LILRLTCPGCNRDSYSASAEMFKPCPYCGILFSGRYGGERRRETRNGNDVPFVFSYRDQLYETSTVNCSESGICLKVLGKSPFPVGDIADLSVNGSNFRVRVSWIANGPDTLGTVVGLKILELGQGPAVS
jgi:hypothetical protein